MKFSWLVLASASLIYGCASGARDVASAPSGPLREQIGHHVELSGRFTRPGKLADFLIASGEPVYLIDPPPSFAPPVSGTNVVAAGLLEYFVPPPSPCDHKEACPYALVPPHYFIRGAEIRVAP